MDPHETEKEVKHHVRILLAKIKRTQSEWSTMNDLYERVAALDLTAADIDNIACIVHEANRAYCRTIGDYSHENWGQAPAWQRDSAREGVIAQLENPDMSAEALHENWLQHKAKDGWSYGPVKDEKIHQHPCFVPYSDLPVEQRRKDHLFRAIVNALDPRRS